MMSGGRVGGVQLIQIGEQQGQELGVEKGKWKGGLTPTVLAPNLLRGRDETDAWRRRHTVTFVGQVTRCPHGLNLIITILRKKKEGSGIRRQKVDK